MIRAIALAGAALLTLSAPPAGGQSAPPEFSAADYLLTQLGDGTAGDAFAGQLLSALARFDRAGDGLDAADVENAEQSQNAERRGQAVGGLLSFDLNHDAIVERAEILASRRESNEGQPDRSRTAQELLQRFDSNRDDRITPDEYLTWPGEHQYDYYVTQLRALLAMDPNGDGRVTADEVRALAAPVFNAFDRNHDGQLSRTEGQRVEPARAAASERIAPMLAEFSAPRCEMPAVPAGARVILVGTYTSEALSTVAIGGEEQATNHIEVRIEPGREPLYLVLSSYHSMLWRLSGDVGRVAAVVVDSYEAARGGYAAAGVAGVAAGRVTVLRGRCLAFFNDATRGNDLWRNIGAIRLATGRRPDAVFASHYLGSVSLPSGELAYVRPDTYPPERPVPPGYDPAMWRDTLRFWRWGVVETDPRQVVGPAGAETYRVMPHQAGLAQLLASGALERTPDSGLFRIVRPIPHIPSMLGGSHSVRFVLARGVPVPPGDLVHSCMLVEETGEMLGNPSICRR
jgi:Ca2+-binding EF-hand superfamily protein